MSVLPAHLKPRDFYGFTDEQYISYWHSRCSTNENGCWLWPVQIERKDRPGHFRYAEASYHGKRVKLNRKVLSIKIGRALTDLEQSLHTCDDPRCINPDHLYVGDRIANMKDAAAKRRLFRQASDQCLRGHAYTPDNTYWSPTKAGNLARNCKTCSRERQRSYRIEKPEMVKARQRRTRLRRKMRLQSRVTGES